VLPAKEVCGSTVTVTYHVGTGSGLRVVLVTVGLTL
jgi:hypothetical protein